jgi:hypothetical protein
MGLKLEFLTELRVSVAIVVFSLVPLLLLDPFACQDEPDPLWLYGLFVFTFSFAFVWLTVAVLSRWLDRPLAVIASLCTYFSIGFIGWGISTLLAVTSLDRELLQQGVIWIPFWILGVLLGGDVLSVCSPD